MKSEKFRDRPEREIDEPSQRRAGAYRGKAISNLKITVRRDSADLTTVHVKGELDAAGADRLSAVVSEALAGSPSLLLDLTGLDFIDGWGLRAIIEADRDAHASGRLLQLKKGPPVVHKVFKLTGFDTRLNFLSVPPAPTVALL